MKNMEETKPVAVVLLSGGMDSAVCAALAAEAGYSLAALHLNYGQRTEAREQKCFEELCRHFGIGKKLVVDVKYLAQIGGSSLTDKSIDVPGAALDSDLIPNSYVPFRNANILAIATSWAEVIGARALVIGAMEQDSSGYPDCRKSFYDSFQQTIDLGTRPETRIKILTPIIDKTKADIVAIGTRLGVPFEHTWSCYSDSEAACGTCESCALRLRGFESAGVADPLPYSRRPGYK